MLLPHSTPDPCVAAAARYVTEGAMYESAIADGQRDPSARQLAVQQAVHQLLEAEQTRDDARQQRRAQAAHAAASSALW